MNVRPITVAALLCAVASVALAVSGQPAAGAAVAATATMSTAIWRNVHGDSTKVWSAIGVLLAAVFGAATFASSVDDISAVAVGAMWGVSVIYVCAVAVNFGLSAVNAETHRVSRNKLWASTRLAAGGAVGGTVAGAVWFSARQYAPGNPFGAATATVAVTSVVAVTVVAGIVLRKFRPGPVTAVGATVAVAVAAVVVGVAGAGQQTNLAASSQQVTYALESQRFGEDYASCGLETEFFRQLSCLSNMFIVTADTDGIPAMFERIGVIYNDAGGDLLRLHCHEMLHDVGKHVAAVEPLDEALQEASIGCTGGYVHGLMQYYVDTNGWDSVGDSYPQFCPQLADNVGGTDSGGIIDTDSFMWTCSHILGHITYDALVPSIGEYGDEPDWTQADVAARGAEESGTCLELEGTASSVADCAAGFFMEHALDVQRSLNGLEAPDDADNLYGICDTAGELYPGTVLQARCVAELSASLPVLSTGHYPSAFNECLRFDGGLQVECVTGVARYMTPALAYDVVEVPKACRAASGLEDGYALCLSEFVAARLSADGDVDQARQICVDNTVEGTERDMCETRVGNGAFSVHDYFSY